MKNIQFDWIDQFVNHVHIEILEHGHIFADRTWHHKGVTSPFSRLYFVLDGSGYLTGAGGRTDLLPGNMVLVPLHSTNDYLCDESMEKFYVHFRSEIIPGLDVFESLGECASLPFETASVKALLDRMYAGEFSSLFALRSLVYEAVFRFSEALGIDTKTLSASALKFRPVFEFVKMNGSARLTPGKVAESLGMSEELLAREFKREMGYPLKELIVHSILGSAREKLLLTDSRIKEVAYEMGFYDEFHFSHFFKKHTGLSPNQYRKNNRVRY